MAYNCIREWCVYISAKGNNEQLRERVNEPLRIGETTSVGTRVRTVVSNFQFYHWNIKSGTRWRYYF